MCACRAGLPEAGVAATQALRQVLNRAVAWELIDSNPANPARGLQPAGFCEVAGGPQQYSATKLGGTSLGLEEAHRELKISPAEFDEVAAELAWTLDFFKVPEREKGEVLAAVAAHKDEVTRGHSQ